MSSMKQTSSGAKFPTARSSTSSLKSFPSSLIATSTMPSVCSSTASSARSTSSSNVPGACSSSLSSAHSSTSAFAVPSTSTTSPHSSSSSSSTTASTSSSSSAQVRVIVRVRPTIGAEDEVESVVNVSGKRRVEMRSVKDPSNILCYKFDACYGSGTGQGEVFRKEVENIIPQALAGYNTSVFCYGATGAGKTFTMQGNPSAPGIIPRVAKRLMDTVNGLVGYQVSVSYLEIYNERVKDLLEPKESDLPIRQDTQGNIVVHNLSELRLNTYEDFKPVFLLGCKNRTTAPTCQNKLSSRSHSVLMFKVSHKDPNNPNRTLTGKIHLIDLAGSEDNRRTKNKGQRMMESNNINRSLFNLGKVVDALNDGSARVPFRDSKLTRLLQDSLGGSAHAIMIANVAPTQSSFVDTLSTLNFASKSKQIVNKPIVQHVDAPTTADPARSRAEKLRSWRSQRGKTGSGAMEKLLGSKRKGEPTKGSLINKENLLNSAEGASASKRRAASTETVAERLVTDANLLEREGKLHASLALLRNASMLMPSDAEVARQVERLHLQLGGSSGSELMHSSSSSCSLASIDPSLPESTRKLLHHLNTADLDVLMSLRGIGVKKARRIVDHRKETGFFIKLNDLREIGFRDKSMATFVESNAAIVDCAPRLIV